MKRGAFVVNEIIGRLAYDLINPLNSFYNFILSVWHVYTSILSLLLIQIKSCFESLCNHFNEVVVFACCFLFILNIGLGK